MRPLWAKTSLEKDSAGSLLFAIGQALEKVREGSAQDESHALFANKIVRKCLDKRAITYGDYKKWRKVNPLVFTTIVDEDNQLIGFFDIFPLTFKAGEEIIAGTLTERSLKLEHIVPFARATTVTHLHIATILVNPRQRVFSPIIAKEVLLLKMREFIERHYAPLETRIYSAFAQTRAGEALLKRCRFSIAVLANENEQQSPLYVLRPGDTASAIFRFERAEDCFSRKAKLNKLSSRIENVEIQLRSLIAKVASGDPHQLPSHLTKKINDRLDGESRKNAAFDLNRYSRLPERLEFCDLRELQDTILSKQLWLEFRDRFVNQETLAAKFNQLAALRNGIRHSRAVDEITLKEGEAGIIWFERVLRK